MKTCKYPGCNNPVWSNGLCQNHSPRTPLKKVLLRVDPEVRKKIEEDALNCVKHSRSFSRDEFFMSIWNRRPHKCQHCGSYLGREPRSYMFDHILEKNKYPLLEFEEENIWLTCLECHDNKNRGMISEKYQEKINFVITKFNVS